MVAENKRINRVGKCDKAKLQIRNYELESNFHTIHLGGVDISFGIQWLQTLGTNTKNH